MAPAFANSEVVAVLLDDVLAVMSRSISMYSLSPVAKSIDATPVADAVTVAAVEVKPVLAVAISTS
jgi:hypothetical protein